MTLIAHRTLGVGLCGDGQLACHVMLVLSGQVESSGILEKVQHFMWPNENCHILFKFSIVPVPHVLLHLLGVMSTYLIKHLVAVLAILDGENISAAEF